MTTDDRLHALRQSMRETVTEQIEHVKDIQFLIECGRENERELIASWVEDMCQGLDANTIAEAIRNGGNDAIDNFKVSK
jgi:hypothetical protein